jgi:hypothetical protein
MPEEYQGEPSEMQPSPAMGMPPEISLALERYLAEQEAFMSVHDPVTNSSILMGNIPKEIKRNQFALVGKQVINSHFTDKDLKVRKLSTFRSRVKEEMFTLTHDLNDHNGRLVLDLDQAWIMGNDLSTQARYGMHSKQRTTITNVSLAGRLENQQGNQQQQGGGHWF